MFSFIPTYEGTTTSLREKMRKMARAAFRAFPRVSSFPSRPRVQLVVSRGRYTMVERSSHSAPPRFISTAKTGLDEGGLFTRAISAERDERFFQRPRARTSCRNSSSTFGGDFAGGVSNITQNAPSVQRPVTGEFTRGSPFTLTLG